MRSCYYKAMAKADTPAAAATAIILIEEPVEAPLVELAEALAEVPVLLVLPVVEAVTLADAAAAATEAEPELEAAPAAPARGRR